MHIYVYVLRDEDENFLITITNTTDKLRLWISANSKFSLPSKQCRLVLIH